MFIPYKADVPMCRWPLANIGLMAITCAISLNFFITGGTDDPAFNYFLLQPDHFRLTQLLGAAFVHADPIHLAGNMLFLWVFGNAVNAKMGHLGYLGLYLGAAVFASVAWYFFGPNVSPFGLAALHVRASALGASGAIMGVIGAFLVLYPRNDISVAYSFWYRFGTFELSAYWAIAAYIVMDMWGLVSQSQGVGYLAHVAGTCFGFATTAAVVYWGYLAPDAAEENLLQLWNIKRRSASDFAAPSVAMYLIDARDPTSGFKTQFKCAAKSELEARNKAIHEGLAVDHITQVS